MVHSSAPPRTCSILHESGQHQNSFGKVVADDVNGDGCSVMVSVPANLAQHQGVPPRSEWRTMWTAMIASTTSMSLKVRAKLVSRRGKRWFRV